MRKIISTTFVVIAGCALLIPILVTSALAYCWTVSGETFCDNRESHTGNSGYRGHDPGERPDPEDAAAKLREQRYNEIYNAEQAAYARHDYQETLRLALQRQDLRDSPKVRSAVAVYRGLIADQAGDYQSAIRYFDEAAEEDDKYLDFARGYKKNVAERLEAERQAAERRAVMERKIKHVADAVNDTRPLAASPMGMMEAGDPVVPAPIEPATVDAGNVPSGLPRDVEDAIARSYSHAPEEVRGRVRKGFQAVMVHDWKVARAWFLDALRFDPENAGLKRLAELCNYPLPKKGKPVDSRLQGPPDSDIKYLFPDDAAQPATAASPLPQQGMPAKEAKALDDYAVDLLLKEIENDPALKASAEGRSAQKPVVPSTAKESR